MSCFSSRKKRRVMTELRSMAERKDGIIRMGSKINLCVDK